MPLDVAAALVGFISLSGQVLQGCNYLCDFFADAKDAPATIKDIADHLEVIQPALRTIRVTFLELQAGSQFLSALQDPTPALENCESAIAELRAFVDRHGRIYSSCPAARSSNLALTGKAPGSSHSSQAMFTSTTSFPGTSKLKREWQRLDVARKANQLRELAARLEKAKSSVQLIQNNIGLALWRFQVASMQEIKLAQDQSRESQSETRAITLAQGADTHLHLNRIALESQAHSTHMTMLEQYATERRDTSKATADAIGSLSVDFTSKLDGLPARIAPIVQTAVTQALAEHTASEQKARAGKPFLQQAAEVEHEAKVGDTVSTGRDKSNIGQVEQIIQSGIVPQGHYRRSYYKETDFTSIALNQGPKKQQRSTSTVNFWFGRIVIITTVTEREDRTGIDGLAPLRFHAKATQVFILPDTWLLQTGVWIQLGDNYPSICRPSWDSQLRVFHTHSGNSPVVQAIQKADYLQFRRMLQDKEVTPHDMVGVRPLFSHVTLLLVSNLLSNRSSQPLIMIAELLLRSSSDCGTQGSLAHAFGALILCLNKDLEGQLYRLLRMIIVHSNSNPFDTISCFWVINFPKCIFDKFSPFLLAQDEWDVSELQESYQEKWGKDSWQHFVIERGNGREWNREQKRRWIQLPFLLRRDREHCRNEFGEEFVKSDWPTLCWLDHKPHFWRSHEACQEFFEKNFLGCTWGQFYWESEVPPFWHSQKTCKSLFGDFFVVQKWPSLLQERSFDHAEGQGAWQNMSRLHPKFYYWENEDRESWIAAMVERWKLEEKNLRHSRPHCIQQYGTNFMRDELPSLLRDFDGLPKGEIAELTQDGPDLVPPSPVSRPASSHNSDWETEFDNKEDWQAEDNGQESDEDGWETADEG